MEPSPVHRRRFIQPLPKKLAWLSRSPWILMQDPMVAAESSPTPDSKLLYKQTPQGPLHLNVFYPEGHPSDQKTAIVFFFGGGWVGGSPPNFTSMRLIWHRGAWWPSVPLRTRNEHGTPPSACVEDGKSAIR